MNDHAVQRLLVIGIALFEAPRDIPTSDGSRQIFA